MSSQTREPGKESGGRRLFAATGLGHPRGVEDVRGLEAVLDAIMGRRRDVPAFEAVLLQQNDNAFHDRGSSYWSSA